MEILLKGLLHAALAHQVVHGVVVVILIFVVPILGKDAAHPAQDMGGIGGVIHPLAGGTCGHACKVAIHHLADDLYGNILGKHIPAGHLRAVADPGDEAGLVVGIIVGDLINLPGHVQQLAAADREGHGVLAGVGDVMLIQPVDKGLPGGISGEGEGRRVCQRQGIDPGKALLPAQSDEPPHGGVAGSVVIKALVGEFQSVGQAVRHQNLTIPVGDNAPAGLHGFTPSGAGHGLSPVAVALDDLIVKQHHGEKDQHHS